MKMELIQSRLSNPNTSIVFGFCNRSQAETTEMFVLTRTFVSAHLPSYCGHFKEKHSYVWQITLHLSTRLVRDTQIKPDYSTEVD